jgi:hypothetical protein
MKMCREKLSEIVFPTQFAHDLRDRQLRKKNDPSKGYNRFYLE